MIYPYVGDFLISPAPLQLSFNYCSHKCSYCFANLNNPNRSFDLKEYQKQIKSVYTNNSLQSVLLREKYPVLISNLVDPFATSNYGIAVPVIEQLTAIDIPVTLQTRGGRGVDDVLKFLTQSVWYISIPMLQDSIRKQIEPGAPSIQSRFELIDKLISKGHKVLVGINPTIEDWLPGDDGFKLIDILKAKGVSGIWVAALHFNTKQLKVMPVKDRERIGEITIAKGFRNARELQQTCFDFIERLKDYALKNGLSVEGMYDGEENNFFQPFYDTYKNVFPTIHHFINWCWQNKNDNDPVYYHEFEKVMTGFPEGQHNLSPYLMCMSQTMVKEYHYKMSYRKLLNISWNDYRMKRTLERYWSFAIGVNYDGEEMTPVRDENKDCVYYFNRKDFTEDFFITHN